MTALELAQCAEECRAWVSWLENANREYASTAAGDAAAAELRAMLDVIVAAGGRVIALHTASLPRPPVDIEGTMAILDELVFEAPPLPPSRAGPVDPMRRIPPRPELMEAH